MAKAASRKASSLTIKSKRIVLVAALLLGSSLNVVVATDSAASSTTSPSKAVEKPAKKSSPQPPEPTGYRMQDYRSPVPATLKGANVLSAKQAEAIWKKKSAIFIDVYPHAPKPPNLPENTIWREPTHYSIENAVWLPNVGYGKLAPQTERYFKENLERLTAGNKNEAIVFFCLRNCWMSWNAAKRAIEYGYESVYWFPDGTDAWQEIGQLVLEVKPVPQQHQPR